MQIRDWDEMEKEFGLNDNGNIDSPQGFVRKMKPFCGKFAEITSITGCYVSLRIFNVGAGTDVLWCYTIDMIKPIEEKEKQ